MRINAGFKKIAVIWVCLIIFFVLFFWRGISLPLNGGDKTESIFEVKSGQGSGDIARNLEKQEFIKGAIFFRIYAYFKGAAGSLQAGKYLLSPSMTIPEIVSKMAKGDIVKERITIIEGWNKNEIADYLEEKRIVRAKDFLEKIKYIYWKDKYDFLKTEDFSDRPKYQAMEDWDIEGYLFPDTYFIEYPQNSTIVENRVLTKEEKIIERMLANFDKKLTLELKKEIERQEKSIFQIVTMASLIEKEVPTKEDKELVSGILWKRLEIGMPLQVDATISYITGKKTTRISIEETKIDSPYNTYKYQGLPPGPIGNPGLESIIAAIYPRESDYLYYLSTPEGKTIFSKTLEEHNIAKAKYLR